MYVLFTHPFSQHGRRVVALLEEAALPYEARVVDLVKGENRSPDYLALNPNHQVPTLVDGDLTLSESNAILRYVCRKEGLEDWYPSDLARRAKLEQWLDWGHCRLQPAARGIVFHGVFAGPKGDPAEVAKGRALLDEATPILAAGVKDGWLAGGGPTIADLAIGSIVSQLGFAKAVPEDPAIADWFDRVRSIGGFRRSLPPPLAA